jgi:energy-converting hydrogenase Eha subunit E
VAHLNVSGQLALASVTAAGQTVARYTAFKMGDVVVSGDVNLGIGELTAEIVVKSLDMNTAAVGLTRLDWTHAFDLDGDGQYGDLLDPGAELPTPVDLAIDFTSSLEFRLTGSFSGTGDYTYDPEFRDELTDVDNDDVTLDNVILTFGDVRIAGTAEFALVKRTVSVDENGTAAGGVASGASLMSVALTVSGLGVHVGNVAHLNVSGQLALASVTPAGQTVARYTAFKMGDVVVSGDVNLGIGELTAEIVVKSLDMNSAAVGQTRLDWTHAFDLDGDGQYGRPARSGCGAADAGGSGDRLYVEPGVQAHGQLQWHGRVHLRPGVPTTDRRRHDDVTLDNVILTFGDVRIAGTAEFALVKRTVSVDENGTAAGGVASGASLMSVALTVSGLGVHVEDVAHLNVSGQLALASVTPAGQTVARYTAFKMGDVVVSGDVNLGIGELTAEIVVKSLDMNSAAVGQTRLDWTHAFDLDGDGQYADLLDPGAELPTPVDLAIDFTSSLEFRLTGSFSGTGDYTYDPEFRDELTDVDNDDVTLDNVILTFGDVRIAGTAEFALVKRTSSRM